MGHDEHKRLVARDRQLFLEAGDLSRPEVRRAILESWRRSKSFGVDVDQLDPPHLSDIDLNSKLMRAAQPILGRLEQMLAGAQMSVVLTDEHGRVLARSVGEPALRRHLDKIKLAPGFSYAEEHVGTNGIGTAIQTRMPYQVFGSEHFSELLQNMSCAGVPIRDPLSGRLAGVLDLTCWSADATPLMVALAQEAAADIEQRLLEHGSERERAMLTAFLAACRHSNKVILAITDNVTMSNASAHRLLDANDHAIVREALAQRPIPAREQSRQVVLSRGEHAVMRVRPVECDSGTAGAVVEIVLAPAASRRPEPPQASMPPPLGLAGSSAAFRGAYARLNAHCRNGEWALVEGEPGVGKFTLAEAVHRRCHSTGHLTVIDGRTWSDENAERLTAAVADPDSTLVLRHLDRLSPDVAEWVADLLDGFAGNWVAATTVEHAVVPKALLRRFPVTVTIPPLRHRIDDVRDLVPALLNKLAPGQQVSCGQAALRALLRCRWQGNVAELVSALRTALTRRRTGEITPMDLPEFCHSTSRHVLTPWETLERDAIVHALLETGGDKRKAAAIIGISRATIYRKINAYGIVIESDGSVDLL